MAAPMLLFTVANTPFSFQAELLSDKNPKLVRHVMESLPLKTFAGHVVVAGETFWMPTKIMSLTTDNMVKREPGQVYFYGAGTQFNICYGEVTEKNPVNHFAQVRTSDMDILREVGKIACKQTFTTDPKIVRITVTLLNAPPDLYDTKRVDGTNHWRVVKAAIEQAIEANWHNEPDDVLKVRLGLIEGGAGTLQQSFSILVHLKAYTMAYGGDMFYRLLKTKDDEDMNLPALKVVTRSLFVGSFNHFEFSGDDLGMKTLGELGKRYISALDTVTTLDEYEELTGAMLMFINLMHRWIHNIFPWHHGSEYPHRTADEIADKPKLETYDHEKEVAEN